MKKYWIIFLLVPFFSMLSCLDDTSAYLPQEKENVNVDNVVGVDTTNNDSILPEGELVPGVHLVTLKVKEGQDSVERRFKYFMPVTLTPNKPISLIFEFHGSYEFEKPSEVPDPLSGINDGNVFCQKAIKENCIICFPAGVAEFQQDSSGAVNWAGDNYEKSLPFVDAMVKYFTEDNVPSVDPNRIYSTGQSSGAIFSFVLALHRSEVFAAITPRAGQSASVEPFPTRAVPVRVFAGEKDDKVNHDAVIDNMTKWAKEIGGYFEADMKMDTAVYEGYADVTIRSWHGGKADYEIYSLAGIGHGIYVGECMDDMWDFMKNHTLDQASNPLFVTTSIKDIDAQCKESFKIEVSYTEGAEVAIDAPQSWNPHFDGKELVLTAPEDFYGNIERDGVITITVTLLGEESSCEIPFHLNAPKTYFEVGDIYYNEEFEPIGVVYKVDKANIKEAMVISLEQAQIRLMDSYPLGFSTPDMDNGYANMQSVLDLNDNSLTVDNSAFMWAAQYKGESGWYIPSINELIEIYENRDKINSILSAAGGQKLPTAYTLSSTVVLDNGTYAYYEYNFGKGMISKESRLYPDVSFAIKKVTKN